MQEFLPYVQQLEKLATTSSLCADDWQAKTERALDGEPSRNLARLVSLGARRESGAFFTGSTLANRAFARLETTDATIRFFDPTCGAGDLLLAAARTLPIQSTLTATLREWGTRLAGCDEHAEFIRATKARLALLALYRGARALLSEPVDLIRAMPLIKVGDSLRDTGAYFGAQRILANPPYGYISAPAECAWAQGNITAAALFFEKCLRSTAVGTRIIAILPEVLRSGSRYRRWREMVATESLIEGVEPYGLFDQSADIDVFILEVTKQNKADRTSSLWCAAAARAATTVSDHFAVHVGAVVPHRNKKIGQRVAYIHARGLAPWTEVKRITEQRRFAGTLFKPPFVVVRRTSRPEDKHRAIATIVSGRRPVAIENHLLICEPNNRTLEKCRDLMRVLRDAGTSSWLNKRIRCRHLTVSALAELPWAHS